MSKTMSFTIPEKYFRYSGLSILLGGLMGATGQVIHAPDVPDTVAHIPSFLEKAVNTHVLLAWASTLLLLGLPAIFLRQAAKLRWWGWLALPLLFISLMFEIFHGPVQILGYPIIFHNVETAEQLKSVSDQINNLAIDQYPLQLAVLAPLLPFLFLGLILTVTGILKSRILPKGTGLALGLATVLLILGLFVHIHVLEISFSYLHMAFAYLGATLLLGQSRPTAE